jgi:hypothetical protein
MIRRGLSLAVWPDPDRIAGPQPPQTGTFSMVERPAMRLSPLMADGSASSPHGSLQRWLKILFSD